MIETDLVWDAISSKLFGAKGSRSGFQKINCPICVRMGETVDKHHRCNLKNDLSGVGINCFNCGFKARFVMGEQLSKKMSNFLEELGISQTEINRLKHWAWKLNKDKLEKTEYQKPVFIKPYFKPCEFPKETKTILEYANIGFDDPKFLETANYVLNRAHSCDPEKLYWSTVYPDYLLIPCIFNNKIVGWSARAINDTILPKYNNINVPKNFLYNCDVMNKDRKYLIIVEGMIDAIAIDCISTMGAKLNQYQIDWLNNCSMTKIVVPDRDQTGKRLIQVALDNNWYVSIPSVGIQKHWEKDIKDADDAVKRYGKLWTLHSILMHKTNDKTKINHLINSI